MKTWFKRIFELERPRRGIQSQPFILWLRKSDEISYLTSHNQNHSDNHLELVGKNIGCGCNKFSRRLLLFFKDFIYLFDRQRSQVGREAAEREEEASSPLSREPDAALDPRTPEIMTWAEGRGFNPLSHPGAPITWILNLYFMWKWKYLGIGQKIIRKYWELPNHNTIQ